MEDGTSSFVQRRNRSVEEEGLDPRVHIELEKLNNATDEINRLEATVEEANNCFRTSLNETSNQLQALAKRLGSCVDKSRPYYEATEKAKKLQMDCQRAALQFQRANAVHQAARETIALAEERFTCLRENENREFNSAWQEMLNHATMKIMEAEAQKCASEREHLCRAAAYTTAEKKVQDLHHRLKTAINKSRPYFSHRAATQVQLEAQKDKIHKLQKEVSNAKLRYSKSLCNLEQISEEIHENRRLNMKREPGVGAEEDPSNNFIERSWNNSCVTKIDMEKDNQYWRDLRMQLDEAMTCHDSTGENSYLSAVQSYSVLLHNDKLSLPYEARNCEQASTCGSREKASRNNIDANSCEQLHYDRVLPLESSRIRFKESELNLLDTVEPANYLDRREITGMSVEALSSEEMAQPFLDEAIYSESLCLVEGTVSCNHEDLVGTVSGNDENTEDTVSYNDDMKDTVSGNDGIEETVTCIDENKYLPGNVEDTEATLTGNAENIEGTLSSSDEVQTIKKFVSSAVQKMERALKSKNVNAKQIVLPASENSFNIRAS